MSVPKNIRTASEPSRRQGVVFSDFQQRVNEVKVTYKSSMRGSAYDVNIWYWPAKFDDDLMRKVIESRTMRQAAVARDAGEFDEESEIDSAQLTNQIIVEVVKEWDIWDRPESEGGRRIPPEEIVAELEIQFKGEVIAAIQRDMTPGEAKRQRSNSS